MYINLNPKNPGSGFFFFLVKVYKNH
jgi:hypothetical protein